MSEPWEGYLDTLRRIPDDVILAVGSREIVGSRNDSCLCGWVMREAVGRLIGHPAENVLIGDVVGQGLPYSSHRAGLRLYGGTYDEWEAIYGGIGLDDNIEIAFVERVKEASGV